LSSGKSTINNALVRAGNERVTGNFFDTKKVFDSANQNIRINKFEYYNAGVIRGKTLSLFSYFLVERYRAVIRVDIKLSKFLPINYGVPQYTLLGPQIFIIHYCILIIYLASI